MSVFKKINVLDFSNGPAGGLTSMIMADFGASVIKIEPPKGDSFRKMPSSLTWLRGKKSIVINLNDPIEYKKILPLIKEADVVITSSRPKNEKILKIDKKSIRSINSQIIHCSITGFERKGNLSNIPGFEGLIAAKSGYMMTFEGTVDRKGPVYSSVLLATHAASQIALQSITAALINKHKTGLGESIETSLLRGMIPIDTAGLFITQIRDRMKNSLPKATDPEFGMLPALGYHPIPTKDGKWIQLAGLVSHLFHSFIEVTKLQHIYNDLELIDPRDMNPEAKLRLAKIIASKTITKTSADWMKLFIENGNVAAEEWKSTLQSMDHSQVIHNKDVWTYNDKFYGKIKQLGPIAHFSKTHSKHPGRSPLINEHAGYFWKSKKLNSNNKTIKNISNAPLSGTTFIEFASIIAAPYSATILGELGARIIKVEPIEGDNFRVGANPGTGKQIKGLGSIKTTSNKESICLNLKTKEGIKIAHQLIKKANGMLHNYRPGVTERLSIDWKTVRKLNPNIVYVSAWGYGKNGPHSHRPTAAPGVGAAMGGPLKQLGGKLPSVYKKDIDKSIEMARIINAANPGSSDYNASHMIANATLIGLYEQALSGNGQEIDCNMLAANAYANFEHFIDFPNISKNKSVDKNLYGLGTLYRLYKAKKGWIFLAINTQKDWSKFLSILQNQIILNKNILKKIPVNIQQIKNIHSLILEKIFITTDANSWEQIMSKQDIGCVQADENLPGPFWYSDNHVKINSLVIKKKNPLWKNILRHETLSHFESYPKRAGEQSSAGEQTDIILKELKYSQKKINDLHISRIVDTHTDR
ncbi:MAG: Crotonobetainyl-CoA:carnitine CoA-transferase CaiB [Chloroflexi bacterium]|jgi:crotonobetainyl-CoA:carnitine CoA-transferase CaiB-like acyl-CoA transferase|nr:MAG: Crotonobetainyl-CoA:carnitine CoA-transferase CaiB [Chloroflexota bacterium]